MATARVPRAGLIVAASPVEETAAAIVGLVAAAMVGLVAAALVDLMEEATAATTVATDQGNVILHFSLLAFLFE